MSHQHIIDGRRVVDIGGEKAQSDGR